MSRYVRKKVLAKVHWDTYMQKIYGYQPSEPDEDEVLVDLEVVVEVDGDEVSILSITDLRPVP